MTDSNGRSGRRRTGRNPGTISSGLLRSVQADDSHGWTRMATLYAPLVYYWCVRDGLQSNDAEDVVQEVFRTVSDRIETFRRDQKHGSFRGWLRIITRNKLGDHLRVRRRGRFVRGSGSVLARLVDVHPGADSEGNVADDLPSEASLLYARVLELIRSEFEETTWKACLRVVVDGVVPKDVAKEFGISVNSVYLAKSRVLRRVRDELADAFGELPG